MPTPRNRYKVAEARQQMVDKIGSDELEVETDDGEVYTIPHPLFYDADTKRALKPLDDDDTEGVFRVLMGEEQFGRYVDAGNEPEDLLFVLNQARLDAQDALAGRRRPTRS